MAGLMSSALADMPDRPANMTEAQYLEQLGQDLYSTKLVSTLGPIVMGYAIDLFLCGVMIHQYVMWSANYKEERRFNLIVTACVMITGLAQSGLNTYYIWHLLVSGFGKYIGLLDTLTISTFISVATATTLPVQTFFLERAYRLLRRPWWLLALIIPPMLCSLVGGIAAPIVSSTLDSFLEITTTVPWLYVWSVGTVVADLLLTGFMMYGLSKNKTGWSHTDQFINRLIRTAIETQLPGTIFGVGFIISMAVQPISFGNIMLEMFHSKIYIICLLAVLNYRYTLRKEMSAGSSGHMEGGTTRENTFALRDRSQQRTMNPLDAIHVATVVQRSSYEVREDKKGINRRHTDDESGRSDTSDPIDGYSSTVVLTSDGRQM